MDAADRAFLVDQTHGILARPTNAIHAASDRRGWASAYVSAQREQPYEDRYAAVPDHLLVLHRDGPVTVSRVLADGRQQRAVPPGGLFILPGGMDFGVRLEGRLESVHVYVRDSVLREVVADGARGDPAGRTLVPRLGARDPLIEQLMLGLRAAAEDGAPGDSLYADTLARALAAQLLRHHAGGAGPAAARPAGRLDGRQLARAEAVMRADLSATLGLRELAAAAGLSASHFARSFKASTGLPPHRYLMRLRIERSQELLRGTDASIAEVAIACGFAHQEHMTRVFGRWVGSTPAAWRRQQRD